MPQVCQPLAIKPATRFPPRAQGRRETIAGRSSARRR
jgi:hypothetical protein